jgi:hypothetical protein
LSSYGVQLLFGGANPPIPDAPSVAGPFGVVLSQNRAKVRFACGITACAWELGEQVRNRITPSLLKLS